MDPPMSFSLVLVRFFSEHVIIEGVGINSFFFLNDTAPPEISPLPPHVAFPISPDGSTSTSRGWPATAKPVARSGNQAANAGSGRSVSVPPGTSAVRPRAACSSVTPAAAARSEEHTSELQSQSNLVCRLLLEKKK